MHTALTFGLRYGILSLSSSSYIQLKFLHSTCTQHSHLNEGVGCLISNIFSIILIYFSLIFYTHTQHSTCTQNSHLDEGVGYALPFHICLDGPLPCMYACMHLYMYVYIWTAHCHVCMYACMYVSMYVI